MIFLSFNVPGNGFSGLAAPSAVLMFVSPGAALSVLCQLWMCATGPPRLSLPRLGNAASLQKCLGMAAAARGACGFHCDRLPVLVS